MQTLLTFLHQPSASARWRISGWLLSLTFCLLPLMMRAQPPLTVDNMVYTVPYNGTYQDFTVPGNASRIILTLKGGDGGSAYAEYDDGAAVEHNCFANGGQGASVTATFNVGIGFGKIPPGSVIRFIVGGVGVSGSRATSVGGTYAAGGGGGATGILIKAPAASSFTPLAIAGAGGGAYQGVAFVGCVDNSPGGGGNYGSGGDGGGGDIDPGGGGAGGGGGGSNGLLGGGGGGGFLSDGNGVVCVGLSSSLGIVVDVAGEGHMAEETGSAPGQSEGCSTFVGWSIGGFGYGSGGAGADVGGGGGGYSGGGSGGSTGGGGGGGSYVNSIRRSQSGSDGGTTATPLDGTASYQVIPRPDNDACAGARTLVCGGTSTGSTEFASGDDAPADCGPEGADRGVWFKFTGTGDIMQVGAAGTGGGLNDARVHIYSGANCGSLTCVGGNDDIDFPTNVDALYEFCSVKNQQYFVYLDGVDGTGGNYSITLNCVNIPPVITCPPNQTVAANATCSGMVGARVLVSKSDNCTASANIMEAQSPAAGTVLMGHGDFETVTLTATDEAGNTSTCSLRVTLQDVSAPGITCPANIVKNTDPGQCSAVTTYSVLATDNCGVATNIPIWGLASGSAFPLGTTVVIWQVTDGVERTATCSFTVTVNDNQAPTISCPPTLNKNTDPNLCTAVVTYATPVFSDNCSGASAVITNGLPSGAQFPKGTTVVAWKVTDAAGLMAHCSFHVVVTDNQKPTIVCPANFNKGTEANVCTATVFYAVKGLSDNCPGATSALHSGLPSGSAFPKGVSTVVLRATDAGGLTNTCAFTVTVTDVQAPSITCPGNLVKSTDPNMCTAITTYSAPTAADNCTPAPTVALHSGLANGAAFPKGINTVVWKATDGAGLTKTCSFRVTVNDTQAPAISCPSNQNLTTAAGQCSIVATYTNATFTDNCPGGAVQRWSGPVSGATLSSGVHLVTFKATDASGNFSVCTLTIAVNDGQLPSITCPANIVQSSDPNHCSAVVVYAEPAGTDNCPGVESVLWNGLASYSEFPAGATTVIWKAIDAGGLTQTCSFSVTIHDTQLPTIVCPPSTTVNGGAAPCTFPSAQLTSASASDNCAVTSLTSNAPANLPGNATTSVTWTARDAANNMKSCTYSVTVSCGTGSQAGGGNTSFAARSQQSIPALSLAPNPGATQVTVGIEGLGTNGGELRVFNELGSLLISRSIRADQQQLDLDVSGADFPAGLYQVSLRTENGVVTKTLIVNKL